MHLLVAAATLIFVKGLESTGQNVYYKCPDQFFRAGNQCYHLSKDQLTWREAHFKCQDLHGSELATLDRRIKDKSLRFRLNKRQEPYERWIGGTYDWQRSLWIWGSTGKKIRYQAFSRNRPDSMHKWKCAIVNPRNRHRWGARSCLEKKHYICEAPLHKVRVELNLRPSESRRPNPGIRRKRFSCPERFFMAGGFCYHVSKDRATWKDANHNCQDLKGSNLAVLERERDDKALREALRKKSRLVEESWIGGMYEWNRGLWVWGPTGCSMWNQDFVKDSSQHNEVLQFSKWKCAVIDPKNQYSWDGRFCFEMKPYICEIEPTEIIYEQVSQLKQLPNANGTSTRRMIHKRRQCDTNNNTY